MYTNTRRLTIRWLTKSARRESWMWEFSSAGRASALQAGGHRFEPCCSHHYLARWCSRLARQPVTLEVDGSSPFGVAICGCSSSGRAPPCQGGGSEFEPRHPLHLKEPHRRVVFSNGRSKIHVCFGRIFYRSQLGDIAKW